MSTVEGRLKALGIELPSPAAPVANYVPWTICGSILTISGQLPFGVDGKLPPQFLGRVAGEVSEENGRAAAQQCAVNVLAQVRAALGSFERVKQCQRLGGFIVAAPNFFALPAIMNGASDLMVTALGEAGRHARSTVGVAQLPLNAAVEVEAAFEIAA
ncbi:RidA family protein [Methylocella sp. CPCC 101449]|jgi:enamine deaminase RidA (YjgF/YER057c/UK114 family)|uniref:RidA family protein n=1 Tax=Methylocella sp. CPCC 101449 TaxID=2987531 RepID=UPI00288F87AB|nr:RidA family protein [Methylocella sp. CPCC 101449]MDT2022691.1 RidA family protein [Methylocella sp. CPCC 101449]HEV2572583.1 RidA family protein [Beijerinckiaceae bacterium]